jgi:AcrR family transcriptional regulator
MSKQLTQKSLLMTMKELMQEKPFSKISTEEISDRTGISRRSFYRYYPDKYELVIAIFRTELVETLPPHDGWCAADFAPPICDYCYRNRAFVLAAAAVDGQNSLRAWWNEQLTPILLRDYADLLPCRNLAVFYLSPLCDALFDYAVQWLRQEPCTPPERFLKNTHDVFLLQAERTFDLLERRESRAV